MSDPNTVRLSIFLSVLVLCALWEWALPRKTLTQNKFSRWLNNLGLLAFNSLTLTLAMPILAIESAIWAQNSHIGLFNWLGLPFWLESLLAVVLLDLAIYLQHLVFHRVNWLWRLHQMHHADQDIDVTTGTRFHPIEILLSMWIKIAMVTVLGASPLAVLMFEVVLNASAMFNHSNAYLSLRWDRGLRRVLVTPDMHRVHHSVEVKETHSNFGFCLSVWDRWFGTYLPAPKAGHNKVEIGVGKFKGSREQWLDRMLTQPFRDK